jgi:hypothetical protein
MFKPLYQKAHTSLYTNIKYNIIYCYYETGDTYIW